VRTLSTSPRVAKAKYRHPEVRAERASKGDGPGLVAVYPERRVYTNRARPQVRKNQTPLGPTLRGSTGTLGASLIASNPAITSPLETMLQKTAYGNSAIAAK
jgi:hypothetical protein